MNITDKVVIKLKRRSPRIVVEAYRNGMLLATGYNAKLLGDEWASKYKTEWLLDDGKKLYSHAGEVK